MAEIAAAVDPLVPDDPTKWLLENALKKNVKVEFVLANGEAQTEDGVDLLVVPEKYFEKNKIVPAFAIPAGTYICSQAQVQDKAENVSYKLAKSDRENGVDFSVCRRDYLCLKCGCNDSA